MTRRSVPRPRRLHVLGASGAGTTTLGRDLAAALQLGHFETDDFFWAPSDPPYHVKRAPEQRLSLLREALVDGDGWVLSGSLCGWGDPLMAEFDAVIFVTLPTPLRLERTRQRERARFGAQLDEGGAMHRRQLDFMAWSAGDDDPASSVGRSRLVHEAWLARLSCPVVRVDNAGTQADTLGEVLARLSALP
ncbi:AAA family ATPase [Deinococcus radiodurans]|jgi:Adenylate kinase and related kinases|nr:AAA family ATPase [Deinococcus radiodurans]QIP32217.1 AAA family ATPase [Deinococcus radiodurans]UID69968.1 hypothetical protein DRO_0968 [Deinococcus radiodurans R1 = ATCC 13939 = DSM 20539]UTA50509.1 AAA family ATPase [Deinococcus radiodurans]